LAIKFSLAKSQLGETMPGTTPPNFARASHVRQMELACQPVAEPGGDPDIPWLSTFIPAGLAPA